MTPTLNRRAMLIDAMASVTAQNWPNIEHIIADGGSDDGTLKMLERAPNVCVLKGPDTGIYDGLNRALAAVHGDIVGWLNSDDLYLPGAFAAAAELFAADAKLAAVCGGADIEVDGAIERRYNAGLVADLSPAALLIGPTLPNAWFFRRATLERVGAFACDLKYAADSDFMQRFAKLSLPYAAAPNFFYRYRRHPGSITMGDRRASRAVRLDMLALSGKWRNDPDRTIRSAARALEGRSRAALAADALRRGDIIGESVGAEHVPAIIRGVIDYAARRLWPRLRRRRAGSPD